MTPFAYERPESIEELVALMRRHGTGAHLLAGGTDLIAQVKKGIAVPSVVIDLKRVAGLRNDLAVANGALRIGARAVMTDILEHPMVKARFPALAEAALVVGSVQIRNRATLAGNICNASPAADTAPPLLAYGAVVSLVGGAGSRRLPLDRFFAGPRRTVLEAGEIVWSIDLPLSPTPTGGAFARLTRRHGVDLAIASVCCVVRESGEARFAFGAVGPRPFAVDTREDAALEEILRQASPISDLRASGAYRTAMLPVLARRALETARTRLRQSPRA